MVSQTITCEAGTLTDGEYLTVFTVHRIFPLVFVCMETLPCVCVFSFGMPACVALRTVKVTPMFITHDPTGDRNPPVLENM